MIGTLPDVPLDEAVFLPPHHVLIDHQLVVGVQLRKGLRAVLLLDHRHRRDMRVVTRQLMVVLLLLRGARRVVMRMRGSRLSLGGCLGGLCAVGVGLGLACEELSVSEQSHALLLFKFANLPGLWRVREDNCDGNRLAKHRVQANVQVFLLELLMKSV